MTRFLDIRNTLWSGALALLALHLFSGASVAAGIAFSNETNGPIQVQGASIVNGMLRRSQPFLILPGQVGWDNNLSQGPRLVFIYDANRPNRILYQGQVLFQGNNMLLAVRPNMQPTQANPHPLVLIPQAKAPANPSGN